MTFTLDPDAPDVTPRDAATVVLLRDGHGGLEIFFVKRHTASNFMGGAYVFPGGKLDATDCDPRIPCDLAPDACASRLHASDANLSRGLHVAAARECLEEAGVLFTVETIAPEHVAAIRQACDVEKKPLAHVLESLGLSLRLSALHPFSRWVTPRREPRRFDARFFLAAAPPEALASHDAHETVESAWLTPHEAIGRALRHEIVLMPPTFRTVQQLMRATTVAEALALAPAGLEPQMPRIAATGEGELVIVLPDDPDHSGIAPAGPTEPIDPKADIATRFLFGGQGWQPGRLLRRS